MLFNKLKLSLAISSILALTACGDESDASPANSTKTAITTMSTVTEGF